MKYALNILLLFTLFQSSAQNLVPNPSFEDTVDCVNNWDVNVASPWYVANSSPDYFTPIVACGWVATGGYYQLPRTGEAMAGAILYSNIPPCTDNEYIGVPLTDTLEAGQEYYVSFYVSLANMSQFAVDEISAYFSSDSLISPTLDTCFFPVIPQIVGYNSGYYTDTINWMLVQGSFLAVGDETYMTIGNFHDFSNTGTTLLTGNYQGAYYLIDDVCVSTDSLTCLANVGINELSKPERKIVRIVDTMGRETEEKPNAFLIYVYSDGTTEKVYRVK